MPLSPLRSWARDKLPVVLLCLVFALGTPLHGLASNRSTPKPTALPQPTRDPNADPYDEQFPELLTPEMLVAGSAILVEAQSGEVIFEKNADEIRYPASTTKIMTALLTIQSMQFNEYPDKVPISDYAGNPPSDSSRVPVVAGEEVSMRDLLYGMMLRSGNDAATALAEQISGNEAAFAKFMTESAAFLGCQNTNFVNAHGYHDPNHYTTARDMAIIAQAAMRIEEFRDVVSTVEYNMEATEEHPERKLITNDEFINTKKENNRDYYQYGIGIKSGFHSEAMYCFVGAAARDGVELISVVFYSSEKQRYNDTKRLMEYGFSQYQSISFEELYQESPRSINISNFDLSDAQLRGRMDLGIRPVDPDREVRIVGQKKDIDVVRRDLNQLTHVRITRPDRAPVTAGETMGYLTYSPGDSEPVEYELYATRTIEARKDAPPTLEEIKLMTEADPNPFPPFSLEFLVVPLSFLAMLFSLFLFFRHSRSRRRTRKQLKRIPLPKTRHYR